MNRKGLKFENVFVWLVWSRENGYLISLIDTVHISIQTFSFETIRFLKYSDSFGNFVYYI